MKQQTMLFKTFRNRRQKAPEEGFKFTQVFAAFTSLPRVLRLVWSTNPWLTCAMALLSIVRGTTPAATVIITKLVIDGVVKAIQIHSISPICVPVILQLAVGLLDRL